MQKIRLFNWFSFEIQSILESQDQTGHTHFWSCPLNKYLDQLLTVINLHQHAKNKFIPFFHSSDSVNFRVSSHDWPHPFLTTSTPKIFNICYNQLKSVNSWETVNFRVQRPDLLNLLWRNSSFRNYAIWLAESILAYISGTRFFPNIGFVQEHSK